MLSAFCFDGVETTKSSAVEDCPSTSINSIATDIEEANSTEMEANEIRWMMVELLTMAKLMVK